MDAYQTHQPVLLEMIKRSKGSILEIGAGNYSTRQIHEAAKNRGIITIDDAPEWIEKFGELKTAKHKLIVVASEGSKAYFEGDTKHWGLVFIDASHWDIRIAAINKYKDSADYLIIHDTKYSAEYKIFGKAEGEKRDFSEYFDSWVEFLPEGMTDPPTVLGSNRFDVSDIEISGMVISNRK